MPQDITLRNVTVSFTTLLKVVLVVLVLYFLYQVLDVLALVAVAIILSAALDPWVDWLQRNRIPRSLGLVIIYLLLFLVISVILVLMVPPLAVQLGELAQSFPFYYSKLVSGISSLEGGTTDEVAVSLQRMLQSLGASLGQAATSVFSTVIGIFGGIMQFLLVMVMAFYLTVDENGLKRFVRSLTPITYQAYIGGLMNRIQEKLGLWLRGQLLLMFIIGLLTYLGLSLLRAFGLVHMDYLLVLALWAGLTEIVPYVGPIIGAIPAVFLALAQSPLQALFILALYVVIQQLENNLIVPMVMKRAVGLNPIVSIVVILIGAKLGGVVGALMSIPVATAIAVFLSDLFEEGSFQGLRPVSKEPLDRDS